MNESWFVGWVVEGGDDEDDGKISNLMKPNGFFSKRFWKKHCLGGSSCNFDPYPNRGGTCHRADKAVKFREATVQNPCDIPLYPWILKKGPYKG